MGKTYEEFSAHFSEPHAGSENFCRARAVSDAALLESFNYTTIYKTAHDVTIHVNIKSGKKVEEPKNPVLLMELRATGNLEKGAKREADTWFNHAHDAIVETFVGITNKKLQQDVWALEKRNCMSKPLSAERLSHI